MEELKLREKAAENFNKIYNCCQSVACTVCERYGVSQEDMFRMTEGFGSGIGGLKDTCGAVMGMFLRVAVLPGPEDPGRSPAPSLLHGLRGGRGPDFGRASEKMGHSVIK